MKRALLSIVFILLAAACAQAQYTTVTATALNDACGQPLANVPYNASLVVPADASTQPTFTGTTTIVPQRVVVGQLTDAHGDLSIVLADNAQISTGSVTSTSWFFSIGTKQATAIGASGSPWVNITFITSGPTKNITAQLQVQLNAAPCIAATSHNLLSATHLDTIPYTPPEVGDLIRGSLAQTWERFAKGAASQLPAMNAAATLPTWQNFNFYQNSATPVNSVGRLGVNIIAGPDNITVSAADDPTNNRVTYTINGCATCGGGVAAATPDKTDTFIPFCENWLFQGFGADDTPLDSYSTQVFATLPLSGASHCYVRYGTDGSAASVTEIKQLLEEYVGDTAPTWTCTMYVRVNQTTQERVWLGCTNVLAVSFQTEDDPTIGSTQDIAMWRYSSGTGGAGDTHWMAALQVNNGSLQLADTGVAPDTNWHKFVTSYSAADAQVTWRIDGATVATKAATFTDGYALNWYFSITALNAAAKTLDFGYYKMESTVKVGP
jgi:hypothetical protein